MLVYSIVVTYNGAKWVDKCFGSLVNSTITEHRIFAFDNGSTDGTVDLIRANFPAVEVTLTGSNLGFGKANNLGMRKVLEDNADFVFLLNQDAWVEKDTIEKLIEVSNKNPEYGVLSPMQYYRPEILDYRFKKYVGRGKENNPGILDVKFVNAAAWLITHNCLNQNGIFQEAFKHYGEDMEYCKRILFHKYNIGIIKGSLCYHDRPQNILIINELNTIKYTEISLLLKLSELNYNYTKGILNLIKFILFNRCKKNIFFRLKILLTTIPYFKENNRWH